MEEEKIPFENLFKQLDELLNFIKDHASLPVDEEKMTPEVYEKLAKIKHDVAEFKKLSDEIVKLSEVPREEIQKRLSGLSEELDPQAKRILERGAQLQAKAQKLSQDFDFENQAPQDSLPSKEENPPSPEQDKKFLKRRQRKFKQLDEGGSSWKRPLT